MEYEARRQQENASVRERGSIVTLRSGGRVTWRRADKETRTEDKHACWREGEEAR